MVFTRHTPGKKNEQAITWEKLIDVISAKKPYQIKAINFYHPGAPYGTSHVDGTTMLELWKQVEKKKTEGKN